MMYTDIIFPVPACCNLMTAEEESLSVEPLPKQEFNNRIGKLFPSF